MHRESRHEILAFVVLGVSAFLWVCLLSHDPGDSLGSSETVQNACGPAGAMLSFYCVLWLGSLGSHALAAILGLLGLSMLFRIFTQRGTGAGGTLTSS